MDLTKNKRVSPSGSQNSPLTMKRSPASNGYNKAMQHVEKRNLQLSVDDDFVSWFFLSLYTGLVLLHNSTFLVPCCNIDHVPLFQTGTRMLSASAC